MDSIFEGPGNLLHGNGVVSVSIDNTQLISEAAPLTSWMSTYAFQFQANSFASVSITASEIVGRTLVSGDLDLTIVGSVLANCFPEPQASPVLHVVPGSGGIQLHNSIVYGLGSVAAGSLAISLDLTSGDGSTVLLQNNNSLGGTVDASALDGGLIRNNVVSPEVGPGLLLPPGLVPGAVHRDTSHDGTDSPTLADGPVDASNCACDPQIPLVCDSPDIGAWSAPPGTCLVDGGDPAVLDADGSTSDVGAGGGIATATLLELFDLDFDGVPGAFDCDDDDPTIYPGASDACADGEDSDSSGGDAPDADLDGFEDDACGGYDCDDGDATLNPDEVDVGCDGIDQDCDGVDDEDQDGDGWLCPVDDRDHADAAVFPGAVEVCNGTDDDCAGLPADEVDGDGDGWLPCEGDCEDADTTSFPDAPEACDGADNDCDGAVPADETDGDSDGVLAGADCDDADAANYPGNTEVCDGADDDCDGAPEVLGSDGDGDGYLLCAVSDPDCADGDATTWPGAPEACDGRDNECDETDPDVHPEATEACDGIDNDGDGFLIDGEGDADGDGIIDCADDTPLPTDDAVPAPGCVCGTAPTGPVGPAGAVLGLLLCGWRHRR